MFFRAKNVDDGFSDEGGGLESDCRCPGHAQVAPERATRAQQGSTYDNRQQAPSDERGPERLRGGLPIGQAAGVHPCNRPSVRQSFREEGRQA